MTQTNQDKRRKRGQKARDLQEELDKQKIKLREALNLMRSLRTMCVAPERIEPWDRTQTIEATDVFINEQRTT